MEPICFPAGISYSDNSTPATASSCCANDAAAAVLQLLPEVGHNKTSDAVSVIMLKEELLRTNNVVMQYAAKSQELNAMMKNLEEIRRSKDDECRRLELELKQTQDTLHAALKAASDREAANARLVEINYRLNEKLTRSEASIPDFARLVKERDAEIAQLKAEKDSAEQAFRAKIEMVKERGKVNLKETKRSSKEVEKLLKQQRENHAVMKVLHEQLEVKNKELRESKRLVARVSKQLTKYKADAKYSRVPRYVFSDEENGFTNVSNDPVRTGSDADDVVPYEEFANITAAPAAGFTSGRACTSSPAALSPVSTTPSAMTPVKAAKRKCRRAALWDSSDPADEPSRNCILEDSRETTGRSLSCRDADEACRPAEENCISDVTMSDFTVASNSSDDGDSCDESAGRVGKELSSNAVTAESGKTCPSEVPHANRAYESSFRRICYAVPHDGNDENVAVKQGQGHYLTTSHAAVLPCARPVVQSSHVCRCVPSVRPDHDEPFVTGTSINNDGVHRDDRGTLRYGFRPIDCRCTVSVAAATDPGVQASGTCTCLSCECNSCSERVCSKSRAPKANNGATASSRLQVTVLVGEENLQPAGQRLPSLPSLFTPAVPGKTRLFERQGNVKALVSPTNEASNVGECCDYRPSSNSAFSRVQRGRPASRGRTVASNSRAARHYSSVPTTAKRRRSRTKRTEADNSAFSSASDNSHYGVGESARYDWEENSLNGFSERSQSDIDESEPLLTGHFDSESRPLKFKAGVTLKIKPCSVRLIDVLAGQRVTKTVSSDFAPLAATVSAVAAGESCDRTGAQTGTPFLYSSTLSSEVACEQQHVPQVLSTPAVSWAVDATFGPTASHSLAAHPHTAVSIGAVSSVHSVATDAVQQSTTAYSPTACTLLRDTDDVDDTTADLGRSMIMRGAVAVDYPAVTNTVAAVPNNNSVVVAIAAIPSEPSVTDVAPRAASAFVAVEMENPSVQSTGHDCQFMPSSDGTLCELPEPNEAMHLEAAFSRPACKEPFQTSSCLQDDDLRRGDRRDRLSAVTTCKLTAIPTPSLADESSREKFGNRETSTGCSHRLVSKVRCECLVTDSGASTPEDSDSAPCRSIICAECTALRAFDDPRGRRHMPMQTNQESEEAASGLMCIDACRGENAYENDHLDNVISCGASSSGGSVDCPPRTEPLCGSEFDQRMPESCFEAEGRTHLQNTDREYCTSAAFEASTMSSPRPVAEEGERMSMPTIKNFLKMPEDITKHSVSDNKRSGNEECGRATALPYEEQVNFAVRELRRFVLDTTGLVAVRELAENVNEVVRQPSAFIDGVIKVLSEIKDDIVANVSEKCKLGAYSPPMHTACESKIIALLQLYRQSMANLYHIAVDMLAATIVNSKYNNVSPFGQSAMCRIVTYLCKAMDDRPRARAMVCDILTFDVPSFPSLIVAVASCWPDLLRCVGDEGEDVHLKAYEFIVMQELKADMSVNVASRQLLTTLQVLCNWSTEAVDPTALSSLLASSIAKPYPAEEKSRLLRLLRSVTVSEPWPRIKSVINNSIWPLLRHWAESTIGQQPENDCIGSSIASDLIALLGSLCVQNCPQDDPSEMQFVRLLMSQLLEILTYAMPHVNESNQQDQPLDIPWFVQIRTFNVLLSLAPYSRELVTQAIRLWVTPNQLRIEQSVMYGVHEFLRTCLEAVSDGS